MTASKSALVTGGAGGIGRALCVALAERGYSVTVADRNAASAEDVAASVRAAGGEAQAVACDVADDAQQTALFERHMSRFGSLQAVFLNAGVMELGNVLSAASSDRWQATLDINLRAQMIGARLAAAAMAATASKGVLVFTASAGGIYPMPDAPVYAASKSGLVAFARSIAPRLAKRGIRVAALCPQAVDTPMARRLSAYSLPGIAAALRRSVDAALQAAGIGSKGRKQGLQTDQAASFGSLGGKLLTPKQVTEAALYLLEGDAAPGTVLLLHVSGHAYEHSFHKASLRAVSLADRGGKWPPPQVAGREALLRWAAASPPATCRRVQVFQLSSDFRAATRLAEGPVSAPGEGQVLIRRAWAGVNASDVNFTSGRYFGSPQQSAARLPFDAGFEAVGAVAAVGPGVTGLRVGDAVAELAGSGAFCEWGLLPARLALPAPACAPEVVALLTSGLTASIGLQEAGQLGSGETVLITAAAGGTGQFAVQLAKAAGNYVVATCGSADKAALLRELGADRVINYREEDVGAVLKKEFRKGVDLVWESVGGDMFQTCLKALAPGGRLIVIGMMSQYGSGWKPSTSTGLPELLLWKSASLKGFFLPHYSRHYRRHLALLTQRWLAGRLRVSLDPARFVGPEQAADAVEHLQGGASIGKVLLQVAGEVPTAQPAARL